MNQFEGLKKAPSFISSLIDGNVIDQSRLVKLSENKDFRGSFTEIFQKNWETVIDPVQWSFVKSEPYVFRGMHYHNRHDEYFCLIQGSCYLGLKDLRKDSPTYMQHALYHLTAKDLAALTFPRGVLHGWYFPEKSLHIQSVSEAYEDYGKDDNFGCKWNDPNLGITWPFEKVILSERARNFGLLKDLPHFFKLF